MLNEEDVLFGLWKRRGAADETRAALSCIQHGLLQAGQDYLLDAIRKAAAGAFPPPTPGRVLDLGFQGLGFGSRVYPRPGWGTAPGTRVWQDKGMLQAGQDYLLDAVRKAAAGAFPPPTPGRVHHLETPNAF